MIACLYDIHGNLPALEAVLADARARGAQRFILGGDYAVFGGWPQETVDLLRTLEDAIWVRGNVDRWAANPGDAPDEEPARSGVRACRDALAPGDVEALGALPFDAVHDGIRITHASPADDVRSFLPEPLDTDDELLAGLAERRLMFGHFHVAFRREHDGIELIGPGSVGLPLDGDHRSSYALLHPGGAVEHRRVAYDHAASAARLRDVFGGEPFAGIVAGRIERASP